MTGQGHLRGTAFAASIVLVALLLVVSGVPAFAEIVFPTLTGRVVDGAALLKPDEKAAIEADLAALETKSSDQVVVVTLPSLQGYEIEDFGYQLGRKWGIGQAGKDNGVLLIIAPNERKVRIEVGRGLEPIMTDLMSRIIIENGILPEFRAKRFGDGIRAGVRDIKDTLLGDAEAVKERAKGLHPLETDWVGLIIICFWIAIMVYIFWSQYRYAQQLKKNPALRRRRGRDGSIIAVPTGSSGNWSGGGWSSSSGGGGSSWSGGGGGFGGGGSSGSW